MSVSSGGSLKSTQGGTATGELLMLLHYRPTRARAPGRLAPRDRDALWRLTPTATLPGATPLGATGQTTWSPPTPSITAADQGHSSPSITKCGLPSTSPVRPTSLRSTRSHSRAGRRLDPSSTKRDPTSRCLVPSARGSMLTTGSATVMYANLHLLSIIPSMLARHANLIDG